MSPRPRRRPGLALFVVTAVLGVMAALSAAFVALTRLERQASSRRIHAAQAILLARSGVEDAMARLGSGQEPAYGGEDWDGDGTLSPYEAAQEVYRPTGAGTPPDAGDCPARHALRPSFFARASGGLPGVVRAEGRDRGYTGALDGRTYAVQVEDLNGRIHLNAGKLGDLSGDLPSNAPLVRMLDNLDGIVTGVKTLGSDLVAGRPSRGYSSWSQVQAVLGPARMNLFRPYLTLDAWVDPSTVEPQPVSDRPHRFLDIDDAHRIGTPPAQVAGAPALPGFSGSGTEGDPWAQVTIGDVPNYAVRWEREFVYSWRQLRLGRVERAPRAPLALNAASREVLAAALQGLSGTYLEAWDGTSGWDGGFYGQWAYSAVQGTYPYPSPATDDSPWHKTRSDYGTPLGTAARPWYGPSTYDGMTWTGGMPVVACHPLGRLRETIEITKEQALEVAKAVRDRIGQAGPFRTWTEFNRFVDLLPRWEDVDLDGVLDGAPYTVTGDSGTYVRRRFEREDWDSDGVLDRETFTSSGGSWAGLPLWSDLTASPSGVHGLTAFQKDVLKAMANPNTDLNDFNPDASLFKEVDKTDLLNHTTEFTLDPTGCFGVRASGRVLRADGKVLASCTLGVRGQAFEGHRDTTQADFLRGYASGDRLLPEIFPPIAPASYGLAGGQALVSHPEPQTGPAGAPVDGARFDGQVSLGFVAAGAAPDERLRGDLFDTVDATATGDAAVPDFHGPRKGPLVAGAGVETGGVFPDGVYSEKDATLRYPMQGNFIETPQLNQTYVFYIDFWVKPNWNPEATPRTHALVTMSPGSMNPASFILNPYGVPVMYGSLNGVRMQPVGLYYVPARNNRSQTSMYLYNHSCYANKGMAWPSRTLIWGATHALFATSSLNYRGVFNSGLSATQAQMPLPVTQKPLGRLEGRRWHHITVAAKTMWHDDTNPLQGGGCWTLLGRPAGSPGPDGNGGGWNYGFGISVLGTRLAVKLNHEESGGGASPNHLRFGALATETCMNHLADATFAAVRTGGRQVNNVSAAWRPVMDGYRNFFRGAANPAVLGRYQKEDGAAFVSAKLSAGWRPFRAAWTWIPADLWFDEGQDGWLGDAATGFQPRNDRFGAGGVPGANGLRDVRVDLEVWDDMGMPDPSYHRRLGRFRDAALPNALPPCTGRAYYKAVFVNEWSEPVRLNEPLDVTPFLDDVTLYCSVPGGFRMLGWEEPETE